jgi:hypothetical protein
MAQLVEAPRYKPEGRGLDSECVKGIFLLHNPSGRTMSLGSTQPLTETFPGSKGGQCVGLTIVPPSSANCLELSGPVQASTGVALLKFCTACKYSLVRCVLRLF